MSIKSLIGLAAGALGLYWYKQDLDAQYQQQKKSLDQERQDYVDALAEKDRIINPNGNSNQPPVTIVGAVTMGGLTLNMLEVELTIRNNSKIQVELEDWRCELSVGGIKSIRVIPSNLSAMIIPAGQTRVFRLYARGDEAFPNVYNSVRKSLAAMLGKSKLGGNTYIPADKKPAELDIAVLWELEGNTEESFFYNVPCSFHYPSAVWTVGTWVGYNAGNENQQKKNPSEWKKYDTHDE